jgi:two-component system nitrate/nitrite response regulator NarL
VVVVSELSLVGEAVRAGLAGLGFPARSVPWPGEDIGPPARRGRGSPAAFRAEAGLVISDVDSWPRLQAVIHLIERTPVAWVVVTGTPRGPMWGAVLEAGARAVLPSSTGFKAVCAALLGAVGGATTTPPSERDRLVGLWAELLERRSEIGQRVHSLTPREHEVLTLLHAGDPVTRIAQLLGVSPETVRSQVKAVLRKLQVRTQLGAVAALDDLLEMEPLELRA